MITEQDIIFDELYPEVSEKLDAIMDEVIWDLADEMGVNHSMMMKIVEEWARGASDRLPLTVEIDEKARKMLEECEDSNKILKEWENRQ